MWLPSIYLYTLAVECAWLSWHIHMHKGTWLKETNYNRWLNILDNLKKYKLLLFISRIIILNVNLYKIRLLLFYNLWFKRPSQLLGHGDIKIKREYLFINQTLKPQHLNICSLLSLFTLSPTLPHSAIPHCYRHSHLGEPSANKNNLYT